MPTVTCWPNGLSHSTQNTAVPLPTIQCESFILGQCFEFIIHCCFWKRVVIFCGLLVSQQKPNGGIKRDNFCQICILENPGPTMRHTVGYWIGPASAERLIPLGIYCRNCQAFSHKASSAVECHASLSITSLLSCITEHKITTSCQSVIFFFYQTLICIMSGSIISKEKIFSPNENANLLNEKDVLKVSSLEFT